LANRGTADPCAIIGIDAVHPTKVQRARPPIAGVQVDSAGRFWPTEHRADQAIFDCPNTLFDHSARDNPK
jgi:hypothetical protein